MTYSYDDIHTITSTNDFVYDNTHVGFGYDSVVVKAIGTVCVCMCVCVCVCVYVSNFDETHVSSVPL